jgi:hypothetical protein
MRWNDDLSASASSSSSDDESQASTDTPIIKQVRFSEDFKTLEITHLDDMPEEDVNATWYTSKEYSEIKSSYQVTIFMMESGETLNDAEHTSRGLEYRTQEGAWARYENKRDAYNAVLDEQDRQWKVDKDDETKIRQIYLKHSTKCADAAVVRALQDEKDSREYQRESTASEEKPKLKKKKKKVSSSKKSGEKSKSSKKSPPSSSSSSSDVPVKPTRKKSSSSASLEKERKCLMRLNSDSTTASYSSSGSEISYRPTSSIILNERSSVLSRDRIATV